MSLYALVLCAACWRGFGETMQQGETAQAPAGSVREIFQSTEFRAWALLAATTYGGMFCFLLLSPMVYIGYLGLSPQMYGWIPAGGSAVYMLSTIGCRHLLYRQGVLLTVRQGAILSITGAIIQALGCWLLPGTVWPLLLGHGVYSLGHGIHQPCGQAGAVGGLPHLAGRAVSWSGFIMMCAAFCMGQTAAAFVDPQYRYGAWPMVVPMLFAGVIIVTIAFVWLPKVGRSLPVGTRTTVVPVSAE